MTINNPQAELQIEEVLLQFAAERELPTADQLSHYIQAFPQYKDDLIDFAASLVNDTFSEEPAESDATRAVASRAVSRFHNLRFEQERAQVGRAPKKVENPIAPLSRTDFGRLVEALGLPKQVVTKLRDRKISFPTIPNGLIDALTRNLQVAREVTVSHLMARPEVARLATSSCTSSGATSNKQESFDEALRHAGLSSADILVLMKRFAREQ
ncbi:MULTISPECIES: hypothetical protein [unclassified Burkholderia]|uniref:hypothetical protein n=1 Tax=unclassified Burkholderia TaxID=2613784 RepID=UPI00197EE98F|nr:MULTISPECIES: hypothetical protein [unclassified Burkholderia]MBN3769267.1 hypothetical protein [Burkholderia sp. Se-20378]MBN3793980.1 hypothetical protein [Burkholderia sp. Ac-20392]